MGNAHQKTKDSAGKFKKLSFLVQHLNRLFVDLITCENYKDGVAVVLEQIALEI